jgi:hypothetical protein
MFFMGGMTMGYLHPPKEAKEEDALSVALPEEKDRRHIGPAEVVVQREGAVERTLIWARRILC